MNPSRTAGDLASPPPARLRALVIALALVGAAVAVTHAPVLASRAVWIDDPQFVLQNPLVQDPGWDSARRFVTEVARPSTVQGYYKPLTMISLMLDRARGDGPDDLRPFHASNLVMHVGTTLLLMVWLYQLFGNVWAAALAGLLFGVHPLTVEPVTWIAGRKTMLATLGVAGALVTYVRYTRTRRARWYVACAGLFAAALLAKPTSTPLPVLLLLLDVWPLQRLSWRTVREKVPLLVLAVASGIVTIVSQAQAAGITTPGETGLASILLTLAHNVVFYLQKMIWPVGLALQYPIPQPLTLAQPAVLFGVIGTVILLATLALLWRWTPAPAVAWLFWFVAILPTMGILGVTYVIAADRYAYMPACGPVMLLAAGIARLWQRAQDAPRRRLVRIAVVAAGLALATGEAVQARHLHANWRDTETLHRRALAQTPGAYSVRFNLALFLEEQGRVDEALRELQLVVRDAPEPVAAHGSLGRLYLRTDRPEAAVAHYREAVRLAPDSYQTQYNLGVALQRQGDATGAAASYRRAVALAPDRHEAHLNLGNALLSQGDATAAVAEYDAALRIVPGHARGHYNRGLALLHLGRRAEAAAEFRRVLEIEPGHTGARQQLQALQEAPAAAQAG